MWKVILSALLLGAVVVTCESGHAKTAALPVQQQQAATDYNYQNYQHYQHYYPYNTQAYANYRTSVQKQDQNGFDFNNLFGGTTAGDNGLDGGDAGGVATGVTGSVLSAITAIVTALGLKGLAKLIFGGLGVMFLLWLIPLALSIAALVVATQDGQGGVGGVMDKMLDMVKGNNKRSYGRGLEAFNMVLNSEQCIERISCRVSRTFNQRKDRGHKKNAKESEEEVKSKGEDVKSEGPSRRESILSRISRGMKANDCEAYKCRLASYFS